MNQIVTAITPDNIVIKPITTTIGLTISENGSGAYYLYTDKDIEITNVDVKGLFSGYTVDDENNLVLTPDWKENDSYTFSIGEIKKKGRNRSNGKYEHSVFIKLIDSPYIPPNSLNPLCLRLYIYYTLNGENRRIIADTKNPEEIVDKGEHLVFHSNTYTKRKFWPYSIQLDSIYRPFFFNTALLFFDGSLINNSVITEDKRFSEISGGTFARLYFSIANGCTIRDGVNENNLPKYKIGDINLNISYLNENGVVDSDSVYTLTISDNYRTFSEIVDVNLNDNIKNAHIRGIRESGSDKIFKDYTATTTNTYGGIYLPNITNNKTLIASHFVGGDGFIPTETKYYDEKKNIVNIYNVFSAHTFNNEHPLNISFSASDASIDGVDYKTIGVNCVDIRFPKKVVCKDNVISIPYSEYSDEITYIYTYGDNTTVIDNLFKILGKINVNDYTSNEYRDDDIFNYLYFKHYGGGGSKYNEKVSLLDFTYDIDTKCFEATVSNIPTHVLAIYHGGYEVENEGNEETGDLLRYVNHTNKLLIMKLYKL